MEVGPCAQDVRNHAASLLASLNLQRERAQFCDCVVIQRHSPGQLYPAHRCVLSASSPVLASILSSTGALVELQAPCLSDSVLALLLDYIYTGALPYAHSQQQYFNLLTAASYLQMHELQETLRALQQAEVNAEDQTNASTGAENLPHKDLNNAYTKTVNSFSNYLPSSHSCSVNPLQRDEHQYSANLDACDEIDTCRSGSRNGANDCSRKDMSPLSNASSRCSVDRSTESNVNTHDCTQVTYLTPQDLIQSTPCTTEVHRVSRVNKEVQKDQVQSAGTGEADTWQSSTEEELVGAAEARRRLDLSSTDELQEEDMKMCLTVKSKAEEEQTKGKEEDETQIRHSPLPCLSTSHHVSPSRCSSSSSSSSPRPCCGAVPVIRHSSGAAILQLADVSTVPPYHPLSQGSVSCSRAPDSRSGGTDSDSNVEGMTVKHKSYCDAQSQENKDWSDRCAMQDLCYKSNVNHSVIHSHAHMDNGLSHIREHNDPRAHCDLFQSKNQRDDSVPQKKCKSDVSLEDFPSKYQRLDSSNFHNVLIAAAAEEPCIRTQDARAGVPLPPQDPDTGSDSRCEGLCPEGEAKEEHGYSSGCSAEVDRRASCCDLYGPDWYPNLHRAETRKDPASERRHSVDACLSVSTTPESSFENVTGSFPAFECHTSVEPESITESHLTFTMENDTSHPTCGVVGQSYHGHLHYHCLPQEDTHRNYHPDHSDQSTDEEEVSSFTGPGSSDQVLLLDISAKPAELLVSCKHRSDGGEKWVAFGGKDTFGNGFGNDDREQWNEATPGSTRTQSVDEAKSLVGETNAARKSVGKGQRRPGAEVIHRAGNQTATLTICSPRSVPESEQASMSSTLSVPSALSASMPTNISAHPSAPVHHPFQCSLCERSFSQRGSLNRHVRSHLGVRPFPCPRCPMTFSRQYRVTEHMRVHQRCVLGGDFQKPPASSI